MTVSANAFVQTEANGKTRPYDIHNVGQTMTRIAHRRRGEAVTDALTIAQKFVRSQETVLHLLAAPLKSRTISRINFKPRDYLDRVDACGSIRRKFAVTAATSQGQRAI